MCNVQSTARQATAAVYACVSHTIIGRAGGEHRVAHDAAFHQLVRVARLRDANAVDGELTTRPIVG